MSAANIRQAIETIVADELGTEFRAHKMYFDIEGNDERSLDNGYSVLWGDMSEAPSRVDQYLSVIQDFIIKISVRAFINATDSKAVEKVDGAFVSVNEILKRCVRDKLDQSSLVNEVRLRGLNAPMTFNNQQRGIVKIEIGLTVAYLIT